MLVNCPKCGFSQPKDRYCASCGVDMDHFRPKDSPFWKKLLGNPFFLISVVFVLVFISILFIRKSQKEDLRARIEYLKGGPVLVERQQLPTSSASLQTATAQNEASTLSASPPATETGPSPTATTVAPPTANSLLTMRPSEKILAARSTDSQTKPTVLKMTATYAEIDRRTLASWTEEMQGSGQLRLFDSVSMGPLNQAVAKIKSARSLKILQKLDRNLDPSNPNQEWFVGTHRGSDPENEMGLFSSLVLATDSKDGLLRGEFEVQRAFRDPRDPGKLMERVSFGGPFELASGAAYVMAGLLPRKFITDFSDEMNPDAFLSIFKSRPFSANETEFILILEFDTSAK